MKKITASILSVLMMLSMVFSSSVFAANEQPSAWESFVGLFSTQATTATTGVEYRGHIENIGDYPTNPEQWVQGPEQLGTVNRSLRLEGFWIQLTNKPANVNIQYRVHVQNVGWMAPVQNGKFAGTEGKSQRIEAIEISLVDDKGAKVTGYSVQYKGHIQYQGDTEWLADGAQLGTTGLNRRLEALEVKIVKTQADMTAYDAAVAKAEALTEADYTAESWAVLADALAIDVTADNTQAEVDAATKAITDATAALVFANQADLDAAKLAVADLVEADYTAESWAAIGTALALPETTNAEVGAKALALGTAAADLVFAGQADLDAAKAEAATKTEADYTVVTYAPLKTALELPETTNAEVVAKTAAITEAIAGLVEVADMAAYDAIVEKAEAVVEADYTAATYAALQTALEENVVTEQDTQAKVDEATAAITAAYDALELLAQVTGVQATTAKTLTVEFNKAIVAADQAKAVFAVKNGTTTVTTTPTWAADGMSVDLTRSSNLQAGDYTVTVTGFDFAAGKNVGTTKVVAPKVSKIEFESVNAIVVTAAPTTATFKYLVFDQYGTDVTKTTSLTGTANNGVSVSFNPSTKTATLTNGSTSFLAAGAPTSVITTLINGATGTTATQTMTIVKEIQLSEFSLGDITYPTGKDRLYQSTTEAGKIGFTALDQFGNAVSNPSASVTLVSSDPTTATFSWQKDAAGNSYIRVTTSAIATGTEKAVTLTAVSTTGLTSSLPMTIYKASEPANIVFGELSKSEIAAGDIDVYMDITVYDQFGNIMTPDKYITKLIDNSASSFKMTYNNVAAVGTTLVSNSSDPNYGKLKLTFNASTAGSATIMSNLNTSTPVTKTVTVLAARALTEAVAPATNPTIMAGGTSKLGFTFNDQYGSKMTSIPNVATGSHEIKITTISGDANGLTLVTGGTNAKQSIDNEQSYLNNINVNATAGKAGVYNVEVIVYSKTIAAPRTSADIIASATTTVTVQQSGTTGMTYSVEALNRDLYTYTTAANNDGTDAYAAPIVVKATDANGNVMTVPASQITNVQGAGLVIGNTTNTASGTIPSQKSQWVIGSDTTGNVGAAGITFTSGKATTKAYVSVNTGTSVKTLELPVTLSTQAPVVQEIRILDRNGFDAANTQQPYALLSTAVDVNSFQFADTTAAVAGTTAYVYAKDQYGVWTDKTAIAPNATEITPLQSTWITTAGATSGVGFTGTVVKGYDAGVTFGYKTGVDIPYSLNFGGTVNKTFTVKIGTEVNPTVAVTTASHATGLALTFNDTAVSDRANLSLDGTVIAGSTLSTDQKTALLVSNTLANGATPVDIATIVIAVDNAGVVSITMPDANAQAYTGTLSLDLSKITDKFGNATTGTTTLTINDAGATWSAALS